MTVIALALSLLFLLAFPPSLHGDGKVEGAVDTIPVVQALPDVADKPMPHLVLKDQAPDVTAKSYAIWDSKSRTIIAGVNQNDRLPLASITKLMTVLLIEERGVDLTKTVTITPDDNDPGGAHLAVPTGAEITVKDLLYATLVSSANNAAEALARTTNLSEADFVQAMNDRATSLGLASTHFTDVTGLGNTNVSSAHDVALLLDRALQFPEIRDATTLPQYVVTDQRNSKTYAIRATDTLLGTGLDITGGKTGFTEAAGGCFASRITGTGGHELIIVVLDSSSSSTRFSDAHALADWAFRVFSLP